jgi:hypothetical protein
MWTWAVSSSILPALVSPSLTFREPSPPLQLMDGFLPHETSWRKIRREGGGKKKEKKKKRRKEERKKKAEEKSWLGSELQHSSGNDMVEWHLLLHFAKNFGTSM